LQRCRCSKICSGLELTYDRDVKVFSRDEKVSLVSLFSIEVPTGATSSAVGVFSLALSISTLILLNNSSIVALLS
jgi:hypothetical protein